MKSIESIVAVMRAALERARERGPGSVERFEIRGLKHADSVRAMRRIEREPDVRKAGHAGANNYWIELKEARTA